MLLKGLPEEFKPFLIYVNTSGEDMSLSQFKVALKQFEETEKLGQKEEKSPKDKTFGVTANKLTNKWKKGLCYECGEADHIMKGCPKAIQRNNSQTCSYQKRAAHLEKDCFRHRMKDNLKQAAAKDEKLSVSADGDEHLFTFSFRASEYKTIGKGLLVDTGVTSHIINKADKFINSDATFRSTKHCIELADGNKMFGVTEKKGNAKVILTVTNGKNVETVLKGALLITTYPQSILLVKAATASGAQVTFAKNNSKIEKENMTFNIREINRLYYLETKEHEDKASLSRDINYWHKILGHCNVDDIKRLPGVVKGMTISGPATKESESCDICVEGKFLSTRKRSASTKATKPLELFHTDLCGSIDPVAEVNFKYTISFTDDFSGFIFVYFLMAKSDAILATKQFLVDCAAFGEVKKLKWNSQ